MKSNNYFCQGKSKSRIDSMFLDLLLRRRIEEQFSRFLIRQEFRAGSSKPIYLHPWPSCNPTFLVSRIQTSLSPSLILLLLESKIGRIRVSRTYYQRNRSTFIWISRRLRIAVSMENSDDLWDVALKATKFLLWICLLIIFHLPGSTIVPYPGVCSIRGRLRITRGCSWNFLLLSSFLGDYARICPANLLSFVVPKPPGIYLFSYFFYISSSFWCCGEKLRGFMQMDLENDNSKINK